MATPQGTAKSLGLRDKLVAMTDLGYIEPGWSIQFTPESVLILPIGGIQVDLTFNEAYYYLSGMLIGAQGRRKPANNPLGQTAI